jgi:hypothetical protein
MREDKWSEVGLYTRQTYTINFLRRQNIVHSSILSDHNVEGIGRYREYGHYHSLQQANRRRAMPLMGGKEKTSCSGNTSATSHYDHHLRGQYPQMDGSRRWGE